MPYHVPAYTAGAVAITAGVLGGAYAAYKIYQSKKTKLPKDWKEVGILQDLYIYPIKSCGPVVMDKAECSAFGLRDGWLRDRILMVIDDRNNFITARGYPELLSVYPSVKSSVLTVKQANMETLYVNLAEVIESGVKPEPARVWGMSVPVYDCGLQASDWFTRFLNRSVKFRLVYYAGYKGRYEKGFYDNEVFKLYKDDTGALSDEVSYNLINEASVNDLNSRLRDCQVSPRNFRPNIVLRGALPYEEDNWKFIKIGENIFEVVKPCTRCLLTTIDPETGVFNSNREPLNTLEGYRKLDPQEFKLPKRASKMARMGLQMALRSGPGGLIALNEPIYVA